jgi:hypothetical protein
MSLSMLGIIAGINQSDMVPIYSTTLSSTTAQITIDSIPSTYKHLQLLISSRAAGNFSNTESTYMRLNNNSNNIYSTHVMQTYDGNAMLHQSSVASQGQFYLGRDLTQSSTANAFGSYVVSLWDYANPNTMTTARSLYGHATAGTGGTYIIGMGGGAFGSLSTVSRIDLYKFSGTFAAQTTFSLYGIRG